MVTGLPADASVRSIQEYPGKPSVLFAGTERHLFVSTDSGAQWTRLSANLPTTRYDDIVVHPRTKDLVLGTHGRSIWILDDASPLADWSQTIASRPGYLFPTRRTTLMQYWEDVSNMAQGFFAAENPADGAVFTYYLGRPAQRVRLIVRGADRKVIREIAGSTTPGMIQRAKWDLRHVPPPASAGAGGVASEEAGGGGAGGPADSAAAARGGGAGARRVDPRVQLPVPPHDIGLRGPYVSPGTYVVTLDVDGDTTSRAFEVRADPTMAYTLAQHRAREAFLLDVQSTQVRVEQVVTDLRARRTAADGADSVRIAALERRLTIGRNAPRGKLGGVARAYNGQGALQGSFAPPTATHRQALAEAKAELAAVERELGARSGQER